MGKGFKTNDVWRKTGFTERKVSKVKAGDVINCYRRLAPAQIGSDMSHRNIYLKSDRMKDKYGNYNILKNVVSAKVIVTKVYDHYICIRDLDTGRDDTLNMGDLVLLGIEPSFLGGDIKEHAIKYPLPVQLHGRI